jgi:uncharacterized damage-inducible protein DinB
MLSTLFRYQTWANQAFFAKLEALDGADLHQALRLMNHAYVVAEIFAAHLSGKAHIYASDNTEETPTLAELREATALSDRWYLDYVAQTPADALGEKLAFQFTDGDKGFMSREECLTHVALHGGYHRGEVGRILKQRSLETPWDTFAVFLHGDQPERRLQINKS